MSIEAMNWAYKAHVGDGTAKAVLVALSNQADQDGKCWPSIDYIAERTEFARRTIIGKLQWLEERGYLKREQRIGGEGGGAKSTLYYLAISEGAPAALSPSEGARSAREGAPHAPEQSVNSNKQGEGVPPWIEPELWLEFKQHRKEIRAPLKPTATARLIANLDKYRALGVDPNEALRQSIENQWRGVFPERLLEKQNARPRSSESTVSAREARNRAAYERAGGT